MSVGLFFAFSADGIELKEIKDVFIYTSEGEAQPFVCIDNIRVCLQLQNSTEVIRFNFNGTLKDVSFKSVFNLLPLTEGMFRRI